MNFEEFMNDDTRNFSRVKHLGESQIRNGADVAKELGISRVAIKKTTQRAMSKVYKAVSDILGSDSSPLKNIVYIAQMFGTENDQQGLSLIYKNLSAEQKQEVIKDAHTNYPGYLKLIVKGE